MFLQDIILYNHEDEQIVTMHNRTGRFHEQGVEQKCPDTKGNR